MMMCFPEAGVDVCETLRRGFVLGDSVANCACLFCPLRYDGIEICRRVFRYFVLVES